MNNSYCAFLRGVNVNGRTMKMEEVCGVFRNAGMEGVSSVLATGNLIFRSGLPVSNLREKLERALSNYYSYNAHLFLKDAAQVESILKNAPGAPDGIHVYTFVCENGFETVLMGGFQKITPIQHEAAAIHGGNFFWMVPKGKTLDAGFSKALGRKDWNGRFTSRNINTIAKIYVNMLGISPL